MTKILDLTFSNFTIYLGYINTFSDFHFITILISICVQWTCYTNLYYIENYENINNYGIYTLFLICMINRGLFVINN